MAICRRISNVGKESSSLLPHGVVLCSGDWLCCPPRHPFDLCVRPWPTDVNGDLARDNMMTTSMTPIREGAVEFVNKHVGVGHAIGRGRGVARAVCSHCLGCPLHLGHHPLNLLRLPLGFTLLDHHMRPGGRRHRGGFSHRRGSTEEVRMLAHGVEGRSMKQTCATALL
jgi:hypothetical protein